MPTKRVQSTEARLRKGRDHWKFRCAYEQALRETAEAERDETRGKLTAAFANLGRSHRRSLIAAAVVLLMVGMQAGNMTRWGTSTSPEPPAEWRECADSVTPPHIMASVRIANGGCRCSGAIISKGKNWGAGTSAAHCFKGEIGGKFTVNHPDGRSSEATLLAIDREHDIALWKIPAADIKWYSWVPNDWSEVANLQGYSRVTYEAVGYTSGSGPEYKQVSRPTKESDWSQYNVIHGDFGPGDSGGNIFCNGALVSVISASEYPQSARDNKRIYGCKLEELVAFLDQNEEVFCDDDDGCGPRGCPPRRQKPNKPKPPEWEPDPNIPIVPPPPDSPEPPPAPVDPPVIPVLPPETTERIDKLEQKLNVVVNQVNEIKVTNTPGPAGKDGAKGQDGPPGPAGQNGVVDYDRIDREIATLVRERIDALVASGAIKGPKGDNGTIDVEVITRQVLEKLPPIEVRNDSSLTSIDQSVKLGGTLRVPPVRFALQENDQQPVQRSKPLGESFLMQAVPFQKK